MKTGIIVENKQLVEGLYKITFELRDNGFTRPGQYCIVYLEDVGEKTYSVCEFDSKRFTIVVRSGNKVSDKLISCELDTEIRLEAGLGNGFDVSQVPDGASLVADTGGIPQMLGLLRGLLIQGKNCNLVLGYSSKNRVYMTEVFQNLCNNIEIFTADGSNGRQGRADDGIRKAEYVCAAGSLEMLDRLATKAEHGQYNLDGMNITSW